MGGLVHHRPRRVPAAYVDRVVGRLPDHSPLGHRSGRSHRKYLLIGFYTVWGPMGQHEHLDFPRRFRRWQRRDGRRVVELGEWLRRPEPIVGREPDISYVVAGDTSHEHRRSTDTGGETRCLRPFLHRPVPEDPASLAETCTRPVHRRPEGGRGAVNQVSVTDRLDLCSGVLRARRPRGPRGNESCEPDRARTVEQLGGPLDLPIIRRTIGERPGPQWSQLYGAGVQFREYVPLAIPNLERVDLPPVQVHVTPPRAPYGRRAQSQRGRPLVDGQVPGVRYPSLGYVLPGALYRLSEVPVHHGSVHSRLCVHHHADGTPTGYTEVRCINVRVQKARIVPVMGPADV